MALHPLCQILVRSHFIFIVITQGLELSRGDDVRAETVAQACSALLLRGGPGMTFHATGMAPLEASLPSLETGR